MFRKGGNVGVGIMSGITDRVQAQDGFAGEEFTRPSYSRQLTELQANTPIPKVSAFTPMEYENINIDEMVGTPKTQEEYIAQLQKGVGEFGGADPLTTFLLTGGPQIATATSFSDAISKLGPANAALLKRLNDEAKFKRDIRLAGTKLGIGAEERADQKTFDLKKLDLSQENQVKYLNDQRKYEQLRDQDKRDYDEVIRIRTRAYKKLGDQERKAYEQKLIDEGRVHELQLIKRREKLQKDLLNMKREAEGSPNFNLVKEGFYKNTQDLNIAENMANIVAEEIGETGKTQFQQAKDFLGNELANYNLAITTDLSIPSNLKTWEKANSQNIKEGVKYFIDGTTGGIKEIRKPINDAEKETAKNTRGLIIKDYSFADLADIKTVDGDNIEVDKKIIDFGDTKLTTEQASVEAGKRGYVIIPPMPEDLKGRQKGNYVTNEKAKARERGQNAITLTELENILRAEKTKKR